VVIGKFDCLSLSGQDASRVSSVGAVDLLVGDQDYVGGASGSTIHIVVSVSIALGGRLVSQLLEGFDSLGAFDQLVGFSKGDV
jgi:hypothetical protein